MNSSNFYFLIFVGLIYYFANKRFNEMKSTYQEAISGLKIENERIRTELAEAREKHEFSEKMSALTKNTVSALLDAETKGLTKFEDKLKELIKDAQSRNDLETLNTLDKVQALLKTRYNKEST